MQITTNLYECKHCGGSGTCTHGVDNTSCIACAKKHELSFWRQRGQVGLICGSCGGIGQAEPLSERMNNRAGPLIAMMLTFGLLLLIFWSAMVESPFFSQILAFSSGIIGSIAGFYFSRKQNSP